MGAAIVVTLTHGKKKVSAQIIRGMQQAVKFYSKTYPAISKKQPLWYLITFPK